MLAKREDMKESNTYHLKRLVDEAGILEVVVGKEIELIQEVADVDATQGVHL